MRRFLTDRSGNAEEGRSRAFFCMILGPHANPELYDTPEKREELKQLLKKYDLEVADFACDLWSLDSLKQPEEWIALFEKNAEFASQPFELRRLRHLEDTCGER